MLWFSSYVIVFEFSWKVKEKKKNRRHYLLTGPRIINKPEPKARFRVFWVQEVLLQRSHKEIGHPGSHGCALNLGVNYKIHYICGTTVKLMSTSKNFLTNVVMINWKSSLVYPLILYYLLDGYLKCSSLNLVLIQFILPKAHTFSESQPMCY